MLKIFSKILIKIKAANFEGLFKNPLFFFALISVILFSAIYTACDSSSGNGILESGRTILSNSFFNKSGNLNGDSLFSSQADVIGLETPDLKLMQNNTICALSTPCVVSGKTLGDTFGSTNQNQKDVTNYVVQPGDTLKSIANSFNISLNTLLLANELTNSSVAKVGQSLAILPVDGVLHVVKSGDTMSAIASKYKVQPEDIISYNSLANQDDIYIGDILIVPGGTMPKNSAPTINKQAPLPNNYFIFPAQGRITQGLHYFNAVDLANKCGTPIYAAAAGVVQRAVGNGGWNSGMGNHITILHNNGMVTYYGHLMALLVKPGDTVYTGQNIALMGGAPGMAGAGDSTGCHVHFQVMGGKNPLSVYSVGSTIKYK